MGRGTLAVFPFLFCGILSAAADEAPPARTHAFASSDEAILNPERGFYYWIDLVHGRDFRFLRANGDTLGFASVSLSAYRTSPIDSAFLAKLWAGFDAVRASGIKVILRFKYSERPGDPDAPKAWILHHIRQLAPLLQAHSDVIAVLQAGFIGAWGEWHSSTYGLTNPTDENDILRALLAVFPRERAIQVRKPIHKQQALGFAPLGPGEAFSGSDRARVGHHNDAFLSNENDGGTYPSPAEPHKEWVATESRYVPVGGECNRPNVPMTDGPHADWHMTRFRFSFLSRQYQRSVIEAWQRTGWMEVFRRKLGYRIRLLEASWPDAVRPGGILEFSARVRNDGYAPPFNRRPVYLVLAGDAAWHACRLWWVDVRHWDGGGREAFFTARLRVPAGVPPGRYRLSLWLPDAALSLQYRTEYALRLANAGLWDPASGYNVLTRDLLVDPAAPGGADPAAASFAEAP